MTEHEQTITNEITQIRKQRHLELVGECKKCGKCCEGKVKIYMVRVEQGDVILHHTLENECFNYDSETRSCKIYGTERPVLCSMFPYTPENLYYGCGYHFEVEK